MFTSKNIILSILRIYRPVNHELLSKLSKNDNLKIKSEMSKLTHCKKSIYFSKMITCVCMCVCDSNITIKIQFFFTDDICEEWPHNFQPAPGYWIECSRQKITSDTGCVEESGSDERELNNGSNSDGADGAQEYFGSRYGRPRGSDSLLLEDDEYYPYDDDYVIPPPRYFDRILYYIEVISQK